MDVGSHAVDLIDFLFGPLTLDPSGCGASRSKASEGPLRAVPVEDEVRLAFRTSGGRGRNQVRGQMRWEFALPSGRGKEERLTIVGTRATVEAGMLSSNELRVTKTGGETEVLALPPSEHVHQNFIQVNWGSSSARPCPVPTTDACSAQRFPTAHSLFLGLRQRAAPHRGRRGERRRARSGRGGARQLHG